MYHIRPLLIETLPTTKLFCKDNFYFKSQLTRLKTGNVNIIYRKRMNLRFAYLVETEQLFIMLKLNFDIINVSRIGKYLCIRVAIRTTNVEFNIFTEKESRKYCMI